MTGRSLGALAVCLLSALPARATIFGDVVVTVVSEPRGVGSHGYVEYVIAVENVSSAQAHDVTLTLPQESFTPRMDYIRSLTRTVTVGPRATVRVPLLQPLRPIISGRDLGVSVDGQKQEGGVSLILTALSPSYGGYGYPGAFSPTGTTDTLVLISRGVSPEFVTRAGAAVGGGPAKPFGGVGVPGFPEKLPPAGRPAGGRPPMGGPAPSSFTPSRSKVIQSTEPLSAWSSNWLAYSSYDGIVVTAEEVRDPSAIRTALWQYTECGGTLLILGQAAKVPATWERVRQQKPGFSRLEAGFGVCFQCDADLAAWPPAHWTILREAWSQSPLPWMKPRSIAEANDLFPVVEDIGIPVRGLFVLMLVFTITIGPLNLWILARRKRRIWMLWTVPAISLVTCLAVFGYMLLVEGWKGHLRTETLTILDQGQHRAATLGWTAFYSPLTPGDGLHFSNATEVFHQRAENWWRVGGNACSMDWSQDQHLTRGWMTARVPSHFQVRKSESRHERLTFTKGDGGWNVTNALGEEIQKLWFADPDGRMHHAERVPAGGQTLLTPMEVFVARNTPPDRLRRLFVSDWLSALQSVPRDPAHFLVSGSYLAVMEASPFLEDGLRQAKTRKHRALVLGILE